VLVDHPKVHIIHGLEAGVLHRLKRQVVLLKDDVAVVVVHKQVAPLLQRIAAALGQQAAFQCFEFV